VIVAGLMIGISTATVWFFWTVTVVAWPVVVLAGIAGVALGALGLTQLASIRTKVASLFTRAYIPKLRECLIGSGYTAEGKHCPSVRRQFQGAVEKTADSMLALQKRGQSL